MTLIIVRDVEPLRICTLVLFISEYSRNWFRGILEDTLRKRTPKDKKEDDPVPVPVPETT